MCGHVQLDIVGEEILRQRLAILFDTWVVVQRPVLKSGQKDHSRKQPLSGSQFFVQGPGKQQQTFALSDAMP